MVTSSLVDMAFEEFKESFVNYTEVLVVVVKF
jgi:hypothetical protein